MYRLESMAREKGAHAVFVSVQDIRSELAFVEKLCSTVNEVDSGKAVLRSLKKRLKRLGRRVRKLDIGLESVGIELRDPDGEEWAVIGSELIQALGEEGGRWLFLIDELPVFVLKLLRADPTAERARAFLYWMRELRTAEHSLDRLRWLIAGSIGLDTVTARLNLGDTIGDLVVFDRLGPFTPEVADNFLSELGASHEIALTDEVKARIRSRVGWLIPYHLQILFHELRDIWNPRKVSFASREAVDEAYESLLAQSKKSYFDWWRQRLKEELGAPDNTHAIALLDAAARNPDGEPVRILKQVLSKRIQDPDERDEKLRYLMDVLLNDGYLVKQSDRYRFRSPLLRDFWLRRTLT